MNAPTLFKEYIWLVNTILNAGYISLAEINQRWRQTEMSGGLDMARATFNRHKDSIQDIFGIFIDCDRSRGNKYYIGNSRVLKEDTVQNWMLSTLTISSLLSESLTLNDRILPEPIPSAGVSLQKIIEAMKQNVCINIDYQRYVSPQPRSYTFAPCCLKMHNRRWYVVGYFQRPAKEGTSPMKRPWLPEGYVEFYLIFSLDRIKFIELTDEKFKLPPDFDAREYFANCFGVVHNESVPVERIVIRAYKTQRSFIRDLPWHASQQEIANEEHYSDFEFYLRPTDDFFNHILGRGNLVKVMQPEWLARKIYEMHQEAMLQYDFS